MLAKINPKPLSGTVPAISSKSMAHRIIIAAALANGVTRVACDTTCADIDATIRCLTAIGAKIDPIEGGFEIHPVLKSLEHGILRALAGATLDCGESGTTLRFMLPVACALGA
ncbi:MAG: 3-phosphoshikimate 1-carboxyvinyltransferase, partial [Collinsella intestinalis]